MKVDVWDKLVDLIVEQSPPEDQKVVRVFGNALADLFRMVEQMGTDLDRIATALEKGR